MKKPLKNIAESVRAKLLKLAKSRNESFDYVLSLYARERFLYRLSQSPHRDRLVLKGATVFSVWSDTPHRVTRDLDFLGRGEFEPEQARLLVAGICNVEVENDGLTFFRDSIRAERIRDVEEYRGVRLHLQAAVGTARIPLQIDIGLGDTVTPAPKDVDLPVLLDFPPPHLKIYPPETTIAEKLHAIVKLGMANSRMKDYFDLSVLASEWEFDGALLSRAIAKTLDRRKTAIPSETPIGLSEEFFENPEKRRQWAGFLTKGALSETRDFEAIGRKLRHFLLPVLTAVGKKEPFSGQWRKGEWI